MGLQFEWDPNKAANNLRRHKVSFEEAATVFQDSLSVTVADPDHSTEEDRWIIVGLSQRSRFMKKRAGSEIEDELRPEYDLATLLKEGVRGKYAERYREGTNLVLLYRM